jgi:hypothetical protein
MQVEGAIGKSLRIITPFLQTLTTANQKVFLMIKARTFLKSVDHDGHGHYPEAGRHRHITKL